MKIVIDIPDEIYKDIKNWKIHNFDYRIPLSCILEGTVLPKGHGDLIDRNTVQMSAEKFHSLGDLHTAQWVVDNTPIVIPTDK